MIVFIVFLALFIQDKPAVKELTEASLIERINSIELFKEIETANFSARILLVANAPGSANQPGNHEVSHSFLIGVSAFDEYPEQFLFEVGPFYNPSIINEKTIKDRIELAISFGPKSKPSQAKVTIKENRIEINFIE